MIEISDNLFPIFFHELLSIDYLVFTRCQNVMQEEGTCKIKPPSYQVCLLTLSFIYCSLYIFSIFCYIYIIYYIYKLYGKTPKRLEKRLVAPRRDYSRLVSRLRVIA